MGPVFIWENVMDYVGYFVMIGLLGAIWLALDS